MGFGQVFGLTEEPRDELELSDVMFVVLSREGSGVAREIEASNGKAMLVDSVVIEWIIIARLVGSDGSHADDGVMRRLGRDMSER